MILLAIVSSSSRKSIRKRFPLYPMSNYCYQLADMKCTTLHLKGLSLTYKPRRGSTSPFMERNIRPELGQLAGHSDRSIEEQRLITSIPNPQYHFYFSLLNNKTITLEQSSTTLFLQLADILRACPLPLCG